ncbi:2081_t:CDS:1, partial [Cetraspora pellucida]
CGQDLAYHQSTTTMKTHLAAFHHITKATVEKNQGSSTSQQLLPNILNNVSKTFHAIKKQKELNQYLVKFIVGTVQSLQLIEVSDFINFCNQLDPRYKIPSKKTLRNEIDFTYHYMFDQIKELINNSVEYVSFTLDLWSSKAHISYLTVTCHWISQDFESKNILL